MGRDKARLSKFYHLSPYAYCAGDPVNLVDPDGRLPDFFWDVFNVGVGLYSLGKNIIQGNYGEALADAGGVVVDGFAAIVPFVPGGVGTALKVARAADDAVDAAKVVDKVDDAVDAGKAAKTLKEGPKPNGGKGGKHGNADHDNAIDMEVKRIRENIDIVNIRKNQVQVDINGNRVGNNRPDIQYDWNNQHYNVEVDRNLKNSQKHETVIIKNDPNSQFYRIIINQH